MQCESLNKNRRSTEENEAFAHKGKNEYNFHFRSRIAESKIVYNEYLTTVKTFKILQFTTYNN